jgi:hypothetical protein
MWLAGLERRVARLEALSAARAAARRERERRVFGEAYGEDDDSPQERLIRLLQRHARRAQEAAAAAEYSGPEWERWPGMAEPPAAEAEAADCVASAAAPLPVAAAPRGPSPSSQAAPVVRRFARPCEAPGAMPCGVFCRLGGSVDCRVLARRGFALPSAEGGKLGRALMHGSPAGSSV